MWVCVFSKYLLIHVCVDKGKAEVVHLQREQEVVSFYKEN